MVMISRKIFLLSVLFVPAFAFAATVAEIKTALASAIAAGGPVAAFTSLTQTSTAAAGTAIAALTSAIAQYRNTDGTTKSGIPTAIVNAVKDATDSITTWNTALAAVPNIVAEKAKLDTAKTTLDAAIAALEANQAVAAIATAKKTAGDAVAAASAGIKTATDALAAAQGAFKTIASDPIFTTGGGTAPVLPWPTTTTR